MSTATATAPQTCEILHLSNIDWKTYTRLLYIFAEKPGVRLAFDNGELEIMSPLLKHDKDGSFLAVLVGVLTEEMGLPISRGGSTTLRRRRSERGIEPDECYWIANAHRMKGKRVLDLRRDPPPDLAIEVDVTHSSLDRMAIYAALGVQELWRLEGDELTFHVLVDGEYCASEFSRSFPLIAPADLLGYLQRARRSSNENPVIRAFRKWLKRRLGQRQ